MEPTDMQYVIDALTNGYWSDVTAEELLQIAATCETPEQFSKAVNAFTAWTEEPYDGQTVIEMPV